MAGFLDLGGVGHPNPFFQQGMSKSAFLRLFAVIVLAHVVGRAVEPQGLLAQFTKPLIVISLLLFVFATTKGQSTTQKWLLAGLGLGLTGDVLLMLDGMFIPGLVAFLIGHLCYLMVFKPSQVHPRGMWISGIAVAVAGGFFLGSAWHGLNAMAIPVLAYTLVIGTMATSAGRFWNSPAAPVAAGALLFVLSDLLLAYNRFVEPIPYADVPIMITYALAQAGIGLGVLNQSQAQ
jgi:uncharacterized membrane protein YhhN